MKLQLNEETLNAYIEEAIKQELNESFLGRLGKLGGRLIKGAFGKTTAKQHKIPRKAMNAAKEAAAYQKQYPKNVVNGVNADDFSRLKGTRVDKATAKARLEDTKNKTNQVRQMLDKVQAQNAKAATEGGFVDNDRVAALQNQLRYLNAQCKELERQVNVNNVKTWGSRAVVGTAAGAVGGRVIKNKAETAGQQRQNKKDMPEIGSEAQ